MHRFAVVLVALMGLGLCACGGTSTDSSAGGTSATTAGVAAPDCADTLNAVLPDLDGNDVTIWAGDFTSVDDLEANDGCVFFDGDTPNPIGLADEVLATDGCDGLKVEYDEHLRRAGSDPNEFDRQSSSAFAAYERSIGVDAGCDWASLEP